MLRQQFTRGPQASGVVLLRHVSHTRHIRHGQQVWFALLDREERETFRLPQPSSLEAAMGVLYWTTSPLAQEGNQIHEIPLSRARSMLIGMRIVASNQLLFFSDEQLRRFVADACTAAKDHRHGVRLAALEVVRVLHERMPDKKLAEYKVRAAKRSDSLVKQNFPGLPPSTLLMSSDTLARPASPPHGQPGYKACLSQHSGHSAQDLVLVLWLCRPRFWSWSNISLF